MDKHRNLDCKDIEAITALLSKDGEALNYYKTNGAESVGHAFMIANLLHLHANVSEASLFYRHAFNLHGKSQTEYPLPQSLLQVSLLCLLKAGQPVPEEEIKELEKYAPSYANYIRGILIAWRGGDVKEAMSLIGNAFEGFHSGEEIDALYLEIALKYFPALTAPITDTSYSPIPRHLYMYWDKNPPKEIADNIKYHQELLGEDFTFFNQENAEEWLFEHFGSETLSLFQNTKHPAESADFLRLHVILNNGGWWLDADLRLKSLEQWEMLSRLPKNCRFFITEKFLIHNDFFGTVANDPILANALLTCYVNMLKHHGLYIPYKTGPGVFSRAVSRTVYSSFNHDAPLPSLAIGTAWEMFSIVEEFEVTYKSGGNWHTA
ncbi:hypothetical protein FAI41_03415 [Acetobacteraceae bacterium]|nr:hypothetical protein FAI41_03415 [Acetobacteraceae bacterium]